MIVHLYSYEINDVYSNTTQSFILAVSLLYTKLDVFYVFNPKKTAFIEKLLQCSGLKTELTNKFNPLLKHSRI